MSTVIPPVQRQSGSFHLLCCDLHFGGIVRCLHIILPHDAKCNVLPLPLWTYCAFDFSVCTITRAIPELSLEH
jgi:hypothetical protein